MTTAAMEALLLLILIFFLVLAVYFVLAIVSICYFLCRRSKKIDEERQPVAVPASPPGQAEVSGKVAKVTTCARTRIYPDLEKLDQKLITPSIPDPGLAILTGENDKSDTGHLQKRLYPSLELKNVTVDSNNSKGPLKASPSKEEETKSIPRKVIFTIENENSEASEKQENRRSSKTSRSRSLPWSAKAKHLYPKCNIVQLRLVGKLLDIVN